MATDNKQFAKALATLGNDTEAGFVEQTAKYAKSIGKSFVDVFCAEDDLGAALRQKRVELRDQQLAAWYRKSYPMPYQGMTTEQAQEEIAKAWPEVRVQPKTVGQHHGVERRRKSPRSRAANERTATRNRASGAMVVARASLCAGAKSVGS
jgi:hypothetical protein